MYGRLLFYIPTRSLPSCSPFDFNFSVKSKGGRKMTKINLRDY